MADDGVGFNSGQEPGFYCLDVEEDEVHVDGCGDWLGGWFQILLFCHLRWGRGIILMQQVIGIILLPVLIIPTLSRAFPLAFFQLLHLQILQIRAYDLASELLDNLDHILLHDVPAVDLGEGFQDDDYFLDDFVEVLFGGVED